MIDEHMPLELHKSSQIGGHNTEAIVHVDGLSKTYGRVHAFNL